MIHLLTQGLVLLDFCGASTGTVGRLLTAWTKTSQNSPSTDEDLSTFIAEHPSGGNASKKPARVPDYSQLFSHIRYYIQTKRIAGTTVRAPGMLTFLSIVVFYLFPKTLMDCYYLVTIELHYDLFRDTYTQKGS